MGLKKYFTLDFRGRSPYNRAARIAMRAFAADIESTDFKLAQEVKDLAHNEERRLVTEEVEIATK